MLSEVIFETLANVDDVLRLTVDHPYGERVLKAYADLLRVQWDMDTLPGTESALANSLALMSDRELIERRAELLRYRPADYLEPEGLEC